MTIYHKLERVKDFIRYFIIEYEPVCCLCGDKIRWESFYPRLEGHTRDEFTIHHLDHNRKNNTKKNLKICHRDCHRRHHRIEQREKETNKTFSYWSFIQFGKRIDKVKYTV